MLELGDRDKKSIARQVARQIAEYVNPEESEAQLVDKFSLPAMGCIRYSGYQISMRRDPAFHELFHLLDILESGGPVKSMRVQELAGKPFLRKLAIVDNFVDLMYEFPGQYRRDAARRK